MYQLARDLFVQDSVVKPAFKIKKKKILWRLWTMAVNDDDEGWLWAVRVVTESGDNEWWWWTAKVTDDRARGSGGFRGSCSRCWWPAPSPSSAWTRGRSRYASSPWVACWCCWSLASSSPPPHGRYGGKIKRRGREFWDQSFAAHHKNLHKRLNHASHQS